MKEKGDEERVHVCDCILMKEYIKRWGAIRLDGDDEKRKEKKKKKKKMIINFFLINKIDRNVSSEPQNQINFRNSQVMMIKYLEVDVLPSNVDFDSIPQACLGAVRRNLAYK